MINDNDANSTKNGWVSKSTDLQVGKISVVRGESDQKNLAIKTFFSKKSAYQYVSEIEKCLISHYNGRDIVAQVRTKVLPIGEQI